MSHAAQDQEQGAELLPAVICGEDPAMAEDALDRRAALEAATVLAENLHSPWRDHEDWLALADRAYRWLRSRDTLRATSVQLVPGIPYLEGTIPVTATIDLSDIDSLPFTITGLDPKNSQVPAPSDTWSWTLTDPDSSGASLAVSDDTLSAVVSAGTPTPNLLLSITGQNSGLQGAEAIIVQPSSAVTVGLVPGTPTPETPAGQ